MISGANRSVMIHTVSSDANTLSGCVKSTVAQIVSLWGWELIETVTDNAPTYKVTMKTPEGFTVILDTCMWYDSSSSRGFEVGIEINGARYNIRPISGSTDKYVQFNLIKTTDGACASYFIRAGSDTLILLTACATTPEKTICFAYASTASGSALSTLGNEIVDYFSIPTNTLHVAKYSDSDELYSVSFKIDCISTNINRAVIGSGKAAVLVPANLAVYAEDGSFYSGRLKWNGLNCYAVYDSSGIMTVTPNVTYNIDGTDVLATSKKLYVLADN